MVAAAELDAGPARIRLGASFGVTMLQADDTPEAALSRADKSMYAQKSVRKREAR
jgi:GGDEF domain-containing protein